MQISQNDARTLFAAGGFLLLDDLPAGTEVSIDAGAVHSVTEKFRGFKFLTPGIHLCTVTPHASTTALGGIRQAFFHIMQPRQVLSRTYSHVTETLAVPSTAPKGSMGAPTRARQPPPHETVAVSSSHLQALDPCLAAYPLETWDEWKALTQWIDEFTLGAMIGFDERGDAHADSMTESTDLGASSPREVGISAMSGSTDGNRSAAEGLPTTSAAQGQPTLTFPQLILTRSAPPGTTGSLLTRYTIDKSYLIDQLAQAHFGSLRIRLLAALQLAFLLYVRVQNASGMDFYRKLLVAFAHAEEAAAGRWPLQPSAATTGLASSSTAVDDLHVKLIETLVAQFRHLRTEFFGEDAPAEEEWWLKAVQRLGRTLTDAALDEGRLVSAAVLEARQQAWKKLARTVDDRFGWSIDPSLSNAGSTSYYGATEEDVEDEEDRPVVVEL